jgi:hypothetical protein
MKAAESRHRTGVQAWLLRQAVPETIASAQIAA